jgi:hypothetical protein
MIASKQAGNRSARRQLVGRALRRAAARVFTQIRPVPPTACIHAQNFREPDLVLPGFVPQPRDERLDHFVRPVENGDSGRILPGTQGQDGVPYAGGCLLSVSPVRQRIPQGDPGRAMWRPGADDHHIPARMIAEQVWHHADQCFR